MARLNRWLNTAAQEWGISSRVANVLFWAPLVGAALIALIRLQGDLYTFLMTEDGVVEWLTVGVFLVAFVLSARIARRHYRAGAARRGFLFLGVACLMLFIVGEEISWGQRLLGLETPEVLERLNFQQEINFHNLGTYSKATLLEVPRIAMLLVSIYGVAVPLWDRWRLRSGNAGKASALFVPPFFLTTAFLIVFLYRLSRMTIAQNKGGGYFEEYEELVELSMAFGIASLLWLLERRLRSTTPAVIDHEFHGAAPVQVDQVEMLSLANSDREKLA